ncbi:hypothetical protein B0I35DRAFT_398580 [Stachybotrys elegans]|uniref:Gfo/Idh/MocA-like oxidoreductase N-terminal domain-containing protein n=1 Tax=Stachybotrys elegans TaxID=80388 RepID=A0A8K0SLW0_9HYPO|nr:hypothetical protein B0I35DRAFT_398580 [Stachybotrys elegans]
MPERTTKEPARFLLVGVGPHAKRIYIPHLKTLEADGRAKLVCAVDIEQNEEAITEYRNKVAPDVELFFVPFFSGAMPESVGLSLNNLIARLKIDCVVISTEPLAHKSYGLWAISQGLNIIMDKPITTRKHVIHDIDQAFGIADDYEELLVAYKELRKRKNTFFLITSHRRYHPGMYCTFDMIKEITEKSGSPVTNIISTHCDGMWRLPTEIVDQKYHSFNSGYGKVSHSGYHFLDMTYRFVKSGWTQMKKPDRIEVVSSFITPAGFLKSFNYDDYIKAFGDETYGNSCKYTDRYIQTLSPQFGEIDAALQISFIQDNEPICLAQVNLQHNGFTRRSWVTPGPDLYKGIGRVKHEFHEIKSGPMQTIVIDSRQANDRHDRSKPSTATIGTDNHFEVHVFRNCDLLDEKEPLTSYSVADLDRRYNSQLPGIYSENVKRGILWEALDFMEGNKPFDDLASNLEDHSVPAHIMSAVYVSHIRRMQGLNPVVSIDLTYEDAVSPNHGSARAHIRPNDKPVQLSSHFELAKGTQAPDTKISSNGFTNGGYKNGVNGKLSNGGNVKMNTGGDEHQTELSPMSQLLSPQVSAV